jgi:hypothetical protein
MEDEDSIEMEPKYRRMHVLDHLRERDILFTRFNARLKVLKYARDHSGTGLAAMIDVAPPKLGELDSRIFVPRETLTPAQIKFAENISRLYRYRTGSIIDNIQLVEKLTIVTGLATKSVQNNVAKVIKKELRGGGVIRDIEAIPE